MDNVVIITGANSGIGLECVKQFLGIDGIKVLAISRNVANLENLTNPKLILKKCDVTDFLALQSVIEEIECKGDRIVGVINNAGVAYNGDFPTISHSQNMDMIDINIKGLTNVLELIIPHMRRNNFGTIINLSSVADRYPRPNTSVYAATKAYVKSISDSLRVQNAKYNIRICSVAPGLIDTPMVIKLRPDAEAIQVDSFVNIIKFIYLQPQYICIRDIVVAPTAYEG